MNYFCMYLFHVGYGCEIYVLQVRFDVCCVVVVFLKYVFFSFCEMVLVVFGADVVGDVLVWFFLLIEMHGA